jgi:hypothetical protein
MISTAASSDTGMASAMMMVARQLTRNMNTTSAASAAPR